MKYGENLEHESVPQWNLYNVDYNSLKHFIKVNTIKDQATAITIPGSPDPALQLFEDELYLELCRQHDRVDLFVSSKADEIRRRLLHLHNQAHRLILRCTHDERSKMPLRRQRKFAKYEREIVACGDDTQALERFVSAQVKAFQKILKKYKKWTGSNGLSSRFRDGILTHPKSFTRRGFSQLQFQYDEVLSAIRAASPEQGGHISPYEEEDAQEDERRRRRRPGGSRVSPGQVTTDHPPPEVHYWNEYDDGSEAGDYDHDGGYAIYVNPEDEGVFPGVKAIAAFFTAPIVNMWEWTSKRIPSREHQPLLAGDGNGDGDSNLEAGYGATQSSPGESYFSDPPGAGPAPRSTKARSPTIVAGATDTEAETTDYEYASSEEFPPGYAAHYAKLPSINDQRMARYRDKVLFWGMLGAFQASFVLLLVAAVLITTGRHRLRVEVDAGVTVGVVASLGCACVAIVLAMTRHEPLGIINRLAVWLAFATVCVLNGILLVLVMGNTAL